MSHIHLPDGVLPPWLWLAGFGFIAVMMVILWWRMRAQPQPRRFALVGIFAALMILIMSIEVPFIPYHFNLSVVAGIILGPALGLIAVVIVNMFLAFVGHGGITVAGVNILVMAVEMLVGIFIFRGLMRLRAPLMVAGFFAVLIGLGAGTAASYGVITLGAPSINHWLAAETAEDDHAAESWPEHEDNAIEKTSEDGHLNLTRLAIFLFGFGAIGWILEAILSAVVLGSLKRALPDLFTPQGSVIAEETDGPVSH